jgi:hypothetical protein
MLIYAGMSAGGGETLGEFLRAVITEYAVGIGAMSSTITITGRVQTASYSAAQRALVGVDARTITGARHGARCVIDPLLRPNDTAVDGAESWTVGAITYRIGPFGGSMDVLEVAGDG